MSVKADIYDAIDTSIAANVTEIQTFALWNNQIEHENEERPIVYPAVFVEFASMLWEMSGQGIPKFSSTGAIKKQQKGNFDINVHICFSQLENETQSFSTIDAIIEKVYFAVQLLEGTYFNPLRRINEEQDSDHDRIIHWIMTFNCGVDQCGEADSSLTSIAGGTITPETTRDLNIDNDIIRTGDNEE